MDLSAIRQEYEANPLDESGISKNPMEQFQIWMNEALQANVHEPTAMILSTANADFEVSSRVVLLKYMKDEKFVFFTNYLSNKGKDLESNAKASLLFFWPEQFRQIRIKGTCSKVDKALSDEYFYSRPVESQISAVVSQQSAKIPSREYLIERWQKMAEETNIIRPENWGGYTVTPYEIEFWQGRNSRLHDRILFQLEDNNWVISRLAP